MPLAMLPKSVTSRLPSALTKLFVPAVRVTAAVSLATVVIYIAGHTVSFIVQLFELSSSEVLKFAKVIAALLNRPTLELEFLPQEFEELEPTAEGVYTYSPGGYHPLYFRRSSTITGAWEWSDDGRQWFPTDSFRESANGVPEPPALIFVLRLHVEHLIRRRLANPVTPHRHLPPPLNLDGVAAEHLDAAPDVLCCPISHGVMRVPVVAPSGTTFEYDCIRKWAQQHNTDPVNGSPLTEEDLYPNLALRDMIDRWLRQGARAAALAPARKAAVPQSEARSSSEDEDGEEAEAAAKAEALAEMSIWSAAPGSASAAYLLDLS